MTKYLDDYLEQKLPTKFRVSEKWLSQPHDPIEKILSLPLPAIDIGMHVCWTLLAKV